MKPFRLIVASFALWFFGALIYFISLTLGLTMFQADIVLAVTAIPLTLGSTHWYYRKTSGPAGHWFGILLLLMAILLDALITVPLFILPDGGSYGEFFGAPMFWVISTVIAATATLYYRRKNPTASPV